MNGRDANFRALLIGDVVGYAPGFLKAIDLERTSPLWGKRGRIVRSGVDYVLVQWEGADKPSSMRTANLAKQVRGILHFPTHTSSEA